LRSLLFGVAPIDPVTFVAVPAVLIAVALNVDPIVVLRGE
jgi:hypothetical protein